MQWFLWFGLACGVAGVVGAVRLTRRPNFHPAQLVPFTALVVACPVLAVVSTIG